jgi:hypothetical protein
MPPGVEPYTKTSQATVWAADSSVLPWAPGKATVAAIAAPVCKKDRRLIFSAVLVITGFRSFLRDLT